MDPANVLDLIRHAILFGVLAVSLYSDLTAGKIYNALVYPAMAAGLALGYLIGGTAMPAGIFALFSPAEAKGAFSLATSALGLLVGGGIPSLVYWRGGLGAGDVKLLGAVGALTGVGFTLAALFLTSLVGAVMAVAVLIWKGGWAERKKLTVPYGAAIALGTLWAWFHLYAG